MFELDPWLFVPIPEPGGGAILKEFGPLLGGGGTLNELFVGGAMLNPE